MIYRSFVVQEVLCRWLAKRWCVVSYVKDDVSLIGFVRDGVSRVIHTQRVNMIA